MKHASPKLYSRHGNFTNARTTRFFEISAAAAVVPKVRRKILSYDFIFVSSPRGFGCGTGNRRRVTITIGCSALPTPIEPDL